MRNTLLTILVAAFINFSFGGFAYSQTTNITQKAAKVKSRVTKIGTDAKTVTVKLNDGSKVKGKITEINDDSFLVNAKQIRYDEVEKINKSTPAWYYAVGVGAIAGGVWLFICAARECGSLR